jgi:hypothetical protein
LESLSTKSPDIINFLILSFFTILINSSIESNVYNISNTSKFLNIESLYLLLHHNSKFVTFFDIRIIIINLFNYRSVKFTFIKRRTTFILLKYLSVLISINLNFNQSSFKFKSKWFWYINSLYNYFW